jgi:hypothetical protein
MAGNQLVPCTDIAVLGQVVRLVQDPNGGPFLKRESLKRGIISDICKTKIEFAEAKRSYDFFADDGSAVTLTDEDANRAADADPPVANPGTDRQDQHEIELNQDLTGKDLIQLIPSELAETDPSQSTFDADDLKEGAYIIVRRRLKAAPAPDPDAGAMVRATAEANTQNEITVGAGTLGKIEKRGGFRSEPFWIAQILPNSAPRPFWRTLLELRKGFAAPLSTPTKVVLPASQIVEINHFFDQSGLEWTRFGSDFDGSESPAEPVTTRLPDLYSPRALPLEENISIAQRARVLETIRAETLGMHLALKDAAIMERRSTVVLDDSGRDGSIIESPPQLLHRQCFVGLNRLADGYRRAGLPTEPVFQVIDVDIKVFQPNSVDQIPTDYYAIDLEFLLRPPSGSPDVPIVCRFPTAPINVALEQMAERILSSRFEIRRPKER